jgi:hypothetical protein
LQFEEMYEQRRREVNKEFEKYQKQLRAAKKSGSKAAADKVEKGAKHKAKQKAKQQGGGGAGGGEAVVGEAPRQWNDYTVHFEFPEPTELPPPLLQLIDAKWARCCCCCRHQPKARTHGRMLRMGRWRCVPIEPGLKSVSTWLLHTCRSC